MAFLEVNILLFENEDSIMSTGIEYLILIQSLIALVTHHDTASLAAWLGRLASLTKGAM